MSPARRAGRPLRAITIRALGPVDVQVDSRAAPAELLWKRPLALLVYLARSPRRARTREHLVGLLWPEQPPRAAHHSLNEALRILRRSGGSALMASVGDQIRLADAGLDLDTDRFDRLATARQWVEASALVAGPFMEGFGVPGTSGVDEWLRVEREGWSRKCVRALVAHVDALLDAGDLDQAGAQAQRAVDLDPLSEGAVRCLIRALVLAGLRADALQAYDVLAARLQSGVGTRPDRETAALVERVREGRAVRRPAAAMVRARRAPLVGRAGALARLLGAWRTCRTAERATIALLLGDPGMGKTRLADEVVERARLDGAAVATMRAVPGDGDEPYGGLFALADGGLLNAPGVAAAPPAALGVFAARSGTWGERFPDAPRDSSLTVPTAFKEICRSVCDDQPLALLIDGAQALDAASLRGLERLARDLTRRPCFVLVTASEHPPAPLLDALRSRLKRDLGGVTVRLEPLAREDLIAIARWALPGYDAGALDRITRRVATDSAGLPLLAVELLEAVAAGLELNRVASAWPEALRTLDQTMPEGVPEAVVGAIRVNYHRVSPGGRAVLAALSVLGERVRAAVLGRATGLEPEPLAAALDEIEWLRWVTADSRGYSFVARVVGDVVSRDMITAGQRERIREKAAGGND